MKKMVRLLFEKNKVSTAVGRQGGFQKNMIKHRLKHIDNTFMTFMTVGESHRQLLSLQRMRKFFTLK